MRGGSSAGGDLAVVVDGAYLRAHNRDGCLRGPFYGLTGLGRYRSGRERTHPENTARVFRGIGGSEHIGSKWD